MRPRGRKNQKVTTIKLYFNTCDYIISFPVADEETVKGASGMSLEAEELMKTTMLSKKLSDNEVLTDRLIKLIDEVKALQLLNEIIHTAIH